MTVNPAANPNSQMDDPEFWVRSTTTDSQKKGDYGIREGNSYVVALSQP